MTDFWCEHAWLGGDTATSGVVLRVDADLIAAVTAGVATPPSGTTVLRGLTIPGLVNAHSHAFHRALRSRTQRGVGSFWTWREQMYGCAARLDPDSYHLLARAVFGEMVLAGITAVGEFHYLHHSGGGTPYADPNAMGEALVVAAAEAGLRITLLDTCYLRGGLGADGSPLELNEIQRRFSDGDALSWATRASAARSLETPLAKVGAAIHSVRAVAPSDIQVVAAWAASAGAPVHAHVSEQQAENDQCRAAHGMTPTALLAERGALGSSFAAVHATHLTEADTALLGSAAAVCCVCPTTERDLADGIGPSRALRDAGALLALGSDSHAVIDLFEEARAVELNERLATQVRGHHDAPSLLATATDHGARSLGWNSGRLAVGWLADFTTVSMTSVRTAGAGAESAVEAAVFAAGPADVTHVVVGGRVVVADGEHASLDVAAELAAAVSALGE